MVFLYFGYGSNMLTQRMQINCPSARKKCIAKLKDFKLTFNGYADSWKGATATILESPCDSVWGVVWEISKQEEVKLDRQERGYKPIQINVEEQDGSIVLCKSYQRLQTTAECDLPSAIYKAVIVHGAKEHQLPLDYIKNLEMFEDNGYKEQIDIPVTIKI